MIAECTTLDQIVKEIKLRFSAAFLQRRSEKCRVPHTHRRSSADSKSRHRHATQPEGQMKPSE
jgi:hypothetical protein